MKAFSNALDLTIEGRKLNKKNTMVDMQIRAFKMTKTIRFAKKIYIVYMKAFSNALDFTIEMRKRIRFRDKMS